MSLSLQVPRSANGFVETVRKRHTEKQVIKIHIAAMKGIQKAVAGKFELPSMQRIVDGLLKQLTEFDQKDIAISALETLRIVFRARGIRDVDIVGVHKQLFKYVAAKKSREILYHVLRVLGTVGTLDPITFGAAQTQGAFARLNVWDPDVREQYYLKFVMDCILQQLSRSSSDRSGLLNAILYIFQFDAGKTREYLEQIIRILGSLLAEQHDDKQPESYLPPDSVFHVLRSIVLQVKIAIQPFAAEIVEMVTPFLQQDKATLAALRTMSAIVFALKSSFAPFAINTFSRCVSLLQEGLLDSDCVLYLLQILTHLVIFCRGSHRLMLREIQKEATNGKSLITSYCLSFLSQAIANNAPEGLLLPALRLALTELKSRESSIQSAARTLLSVLRSKIPEYVPQEYDAPVGPIEVSSDPYCPRSPPEIRPVPIANFLATLRTDENSDTLLLRICQGLVLCARSPAIRACHPLLGSVPGLAGRFFPVILLSVLDTLAPRKAEQEALCQRLLKFVDNQKAPMDLLGVFTDAFDLLDRAGYALFDAELAGAIAERSGHLFRAVRFYERASPSQTVNCADLKIHVRLHRREAALGIFHITPRIHTDPVILEELCLWREARALFKPHEDEGSLVHYAECSSRVGDWGAVLDLFPRFEQLSPESKRLCAVPFAMASRALQLDIHRFLEHAPKDSPFNCLFRAVVAVDDGLCEVARHWLERGMKINSNNVFLFLPMNYEPTMPVIDLATFFEEMADVIDVRQGLNDRSSVLRLWGLKSDWIRSDISQIQSLYLVRDMLQPTGPAFVDAARRLRAWDLYDNSVHRMSMDSSWVRLLQAKVRFDRRQQLDLSEFAAVANETEQREPDVFANAICSACARSSDPFFLRKLKSVTELFPDNLRAWKHWAFGNLVLFSEARAKGLPAIGTLARNAMKGFVEMLRLSGPSLHYLCEMCSIYFLAEQDLTEVMGELDARSVEMIVEQLLAKFGHPNDAVREHVIKIVTKFAKDHVQAIAFPITFLDREEEGAGENIRRLKDDLVKAHPRLWKQIEDVTDGLVSVGFLKLEAIRARTNAAYESYDRTKDGEKLRADLEAVLAIAAVQSAGVDAVCSSPWMRGKFADVRRKLNENKHCDMTTRKLMSEAVRAIETEFMKTTSLDLFEVAPSLEECAPDLIAMPGFYDVENPYPKIARFMPIAQLIPSLQRPRKIRVRADTGKVYKYLLKGGEDLRLDQRVMQWLSLASSILRNDKSGLQKNLNIVRYPIIPLSRKAGLIAWAEGGVTLYKLIHWATTAVNAPLDPSLDQIEGYTHIQKLEAFREIQARVPDNLLTAAIWLRSESPDLWFTQKTNFARSLAVMSIVGYLIGLGDRHPSNVMFMRTSGLAVHIDFTDSFDKAKFRPKFPEFVPFRLTRMIVKALGISGPEGVFTTTARFVMNLMRRNKVSLLAFLDIFDKLVELPGDREPPDLQVRRKLFGRDRNSNEEMTPEEQVSWLIEEATSEWNLARMYTGWKPAW
jgi:hypothetical protein